MLITKKITEHNELYLYMNGKLIYKKWLDTGQSKVFDVMAYDKYTYASYTDLDIKDGPHLIHVKANIRFKTTEEGGRKNGINSGYSPNHVFEYNENGELLDTFVGDIKIKGDRFMELGKEYEAKVRFVFSQRLEKFIEKGRKWWIHEGAKMVGEAEIIGFELSKA